MTKISEHNKSLLFLLIFTIIGSIMAFQLIIRTYDDVFALSASELEAIQ